MNPQLKAILLTVLTLSCFVIALIELTGVSSMALFNKYHIGSGGSQGGITAAESAQREQTASAMPKTTMEFKDSLFSFGAIKEGTIVKHAFHFKNTGAHPLLITGAHASCGCTVPSFPKEPVIPGGEGDILVQFDSHGKEGHQHKNVVISSNAQQERMSVAFEAEVE